MARLLNTVNTLTVQLIVGIDIIEMLVTFYVMKMDLYTEVYELYMDFKEPVFVNSRVVRGYSFLLEGDNIMFTSVSNMPGMFVRIADMDKIKDFIRINILNIFKVDANSIEHKSRT